MKHVSIASHGPVVEVRFLTSSFLTEATAEEAGSELFLLVEKQDHILLILNFTGVEFLGAAMIGKLIRLHTVVATAQGKLILSNIRPEIYEVFKITRLNTTLTVRDDLADAFKELNQEMAAADL